MTSRFYEFSCHVLAHVHRHQHTLPIALSQPVQPSRAVLPSTVLAVKAIYDPEKILTGTCIFRALKVGKGIIYSAIPPLAAQVPLLLTIRVAEGHGSQDNLEIQVMSKDVLGPISLRTSLSHLPQGNCRTESLKGYCEEWKKPSTALCSPTIGIVPHPKPPFSELMNWPLVPSSAQSQATGKPSVIRCQKQQKG